MWAETGGVNVKGLFSEMTVMAVFGVSWSELLFWLLMLGCVRNCCWPFRFWSCSSSVLSDREDSLQDRITERITGRRVGGGGYGL